MDDTPPRADGGTDRADGVDLAADLVRIETENPPGNERPCAEFVVEWCREAGLDATLLEEPTPERPQAVAEVGSASPRIVLNGHTDVVPAGESDAWTHDPYGGVVDDGDLYGRGAADMKAGLAVALLAARDLAPEIRSDLGGSLVVHAAMGEETGDPGTRSLLDAGYGGDAAVVLEPTNFRVATAAKGVSTFRLTVPGTAAHASHPDRGANAIERARPLLDAIDEYDARLRERSHPLLGCAYASVTEFTAGVDDNMAVLPDSASLLLDRRVLPGESLADLEAELDELLAGVEADHGVAVERSLVQHYESASIPPDGPLPTTFRRLSARHANVPDEPWGFPAATDAREFVADDVPAIIWGPGDLAQAHTVDEHVAVDEVELGLSILKEGLRELLAGGLDGGDGGGPSE